MILSVSTSEVKMFYENLQKYAYTMMFINIAFIIVNLAGIFPIAYTVDGYSGITDMQNNIERINTTFNNASNSGSSLEYVAVIAILLIEGVLILVKFLMLVFTGLAGIFSMLGVPAVFYVPIVAVVDAIVLYDVGKLLLRIG